MWHEPVASSLLWWITLFFAFRAQSLWVQTLRMRRPNRSPFADYVGMTIKQTLEQTCSVPQKRLPMHGPHVFGAGLWAVPLKSTIRSPRKGGPSSCRWNMDLHLEGQCGVGPIALDGRGGGKEEQVCQVPVEHGASCHCARGSEGGLQGH